MFMVQINFCRWQLHISGAMARMTIVCSKTLIEKNYPETYAKSMEDPYYVLISSYVWNWEYNQKLAHYIKQNHPSALIITGCP